MVTEATKSRRPGRVGARIDRTAPVAATVALLALANPGCTPVSLPDVDRSTDETASEPLAYDPAARPLRVGEYAPDLELIDVDGRPVRLSETRDAVLVVTFYAADPRGNEMLARIRAVDAALVDRLAAVTRVLAVLLEPGGAASWAPEVPGAPGAPGRLRADADRFADTRTAWTFARPAAGATAALTGAFGIGLWESGSGDVQHTFNTTVLDRHGRLSDRFPGLAGWTVGDLIAAIDAAADR